MELKLKESPLIIWGAGEMGRRALVHFGDENVIAFIDSSIDKIGSEFCGKRIIGIDEYKSQYSGAFILITPLQESNIEGVLKENEIDTYFRLSDCPSEFSEIEEKNILKAYIQNRISNTDGIYVYGISAYTFLLVEWISEITKKNVEILISKSSVISDLNKTRAYFSKYSIVDIEEIQINDNDSFITISNEGVSELEKFGIKKDRIINGYDITQYEGKYHNPEIEKLKDINKGETCFIIGHGPSIRMSDLDTISKAGIASFGMNYMSDMINNSSWRPDYYVVCDKAVEDIYEKTRWDEYTKGKCFIADMNKKFLEGNTSDKNIRYHSIRNTVGGKTEFSDDVSRKVCFGATVAYDCIQFAVYLGFKQIYLLGMDLVPYKKDDVSPSQYTHFYKGNDNGKLWINIIVNAYESAKCYAEQHGIKIYNATRGGYLEVFERVDFDDLF